jgi:hypothetical protein
MNQKLLTLILLFTSLSSFAEEDVCCVYGGASGTGDAVQTFARIASSLDCKPGGNYQGKKICAAVKDPENTYCGAESSYQDRCAKCGFFWSGKECLTVDPKEKAKKELKEEEEKKKAAEKNGAPSQPSDEKPATVKPVPTPQPKPEDPDNPNVNNAIPEEDSLYNRKSKGTTIDEY